MARESGRPEGESIEDAAIGQVDGLAHAREMPEVPLDDLARGRRSEVLVSGGRPSQGNRLTKHAVPDQRVECTLFSQVNSTGQFLFQIGQQSPGEPRRRTRTGVYQQVEVAIRARVAPRKGTEHTHAHDAMLRSNGEYRATLT